ncbi:PREDICTED: microfibril-associated glycoprotein 4 isoform X1 [Drosophila arizonae]|uniref:Microfibril-associated glycoprotein 4 isoform X1 n=2 Tax=Drosophila arizonae TaxID=7263 RepID=A0ABM1PJR6_DROAR|nr:PREDICTED: microfibril-associated glycoprotein 4 isoform X1 [Drosophila arizonae]
MKLHRTNVVKLLYSLCIYFTYFYLVNNAQCQDLAHPIETMHELVLNLQEQLEALKAYVNPNSSTSSKDEKSYPTSCLTSSFNESKIASGIRTIKVPGMAPFSVACDNCLAGYGWLVIQRRINGSLNFYRNWEEYKQGFGSLDGEFFIGLEKLRAITALEPFELYIVLEDFNGTTRSARFDEFAIGSEEDDYALYVLGAYSGNAGDSLRSHQKMKFSTYDRDNDREFHRNCAFLHVGAWWYNSCVDSNLNGQYIEGGKYEENLFARGMCWRAWRGHNYGYKFTQMMIRPKCRHFPATFRSNNNTRQHCEAFS